MRGPLERVFGPIYRTLSGSRAYDIGLHIGLERLNLLQLEPGDPRPAILAAASIEHESTREELIANPARLRTLIKRAYAGQPFRGNRVVTCLPSNQVKMLLLSYSVADGASEPEAVVRELRERVKEELDGMVVDYIPVRQEHASRPREAIVAMAPRAGVTAYLDALSDAGLRVAALDVAPAALARLMSWIDTREPAEAPTAVCPNLLMISFGSHSSYLTVVWERRLMLDRPVEFAERRLLARLKTILDIAEPLGRRLLHERGLGRGAAGAADEFGDALNEVLRPEFAALKAEVTNTLTYTASRTHGRSVDGIYVVGGIARYPGIEHLLREQFTVPLKVFDPCSIFRHVLGEDKLSLLRPHSGIAAAAGLALRGVPVSWPTSI